MICNGSADVTTTPSSLASFKSRLFQPFWCQLMQIVLEKEAIKWVTHYCAKNCVKLYSCHF